MRYTVAVGEREAREGRGGGEGDGETNEASGSSRAGEVELVVEQDQSLHDSCGGIVWESAYALEQYMRLNIGRICASPPVKRKRGLSRCKVLELGAGAGLLGLAVAARGAKATVLTDHPNAMPLLERNVRRNSALFEPRAEPVGKKRKKRGDADADTETTTTTATSKSKSKPKCMPLDWTNDAHVDAVAREGPFEIILATDVVFNEKLVTPLLAAIRACGGPRTVAYVCVQERCADAFDAFRRAASSALGTAREVPREELGFVDEECVLFELKATRDVFADARRELSVE